MIRTVQTEIITETIKKMCIEANYSLSSDMVKAMRKAEEKVSEILSPVRKGRRFLHNSHAAMHSTCHCRAVLSL